MNEFELIQHFFNQQTVSRADVTLGIGDDAAIITPPPQQQIVITTDTLVNNIHFLANTDPQDIGYKSLAVNLSDLAAMGATPAWLTLALTLPQADENWLRKFARGFFSLASEHQAQLIGGDLTHGPLAVTIQAHGLVPTGQAILRGNAQPDDLIYVSHTVGDAALALACLQNKMSLSENDKAIVLAKLHRPTPRVTLGIELRNITNAAIDISDGLAADLQHILTNSRVGAEINVDQIPLSDVLRRSVSREAALAFALSGGDDYELCFTVSAAKKDLVPKNCTCIGKITRDTAFNLYFSDGKKYHLPATGYQHF